MLRSIANIGRRTLCSSASAATNATTSAFHQRVTSMTNTLLKVDWTDTDEVIDRRIDLQIEKAENLIDEYRTMYNPDTPEDDMYKDVSRLYNVKETTAICEAYAELAERTLRKHEGMLGFFGDKVNQPQGANDELIQIIRDYIALMGKIEDKELQNKVEDELGSKVIQLKMFVSMENFSVYVAPIAGYRFIPSTPKPKNLPREEQIDYLANPSTPEQLNK